jgi:XisI protein
MDRLDEYRQIIRNILDSYVEILNSCGQVKHSIIVDGEQNNFLLMHEGWQGPQRIHGCIVHVEIIDGKLWIQQDGIETGITAELVELGVPKDKIVLGFHPYYVRQHTGYAIA